MLKNFLMVGVFGTVLFLGNIPFVKAQEQLQPAAVQAGIVNEAPAPAAEAAGDDSGEAGQAADEPESADDEDFAFGTVVSASENSITILEYDFDSETEKEATYAVKAETQFENAVSLKDILANDEVEINYKEQDGNKVATFISKDLPMEEGDDAYLDDLGSEEDQGAVGSVPMDSPAAPVPESVPAK